MTHRSANRRRVGLGALLVGGLIGLVWFGWPAVSRHHLATASLPPRPDLKAWPAELTDKIAQSEALARGFFRPEKGLAALSRLYHANDFYREAIRCYEGLQRLEPEEARWHHLHARILAEFGRLDEALPAMQRAVALAPAYIPARLRLGDIFLKTNQNASAANSYTEVLARDPENPYALLGLARCDLDGGDWAKAREHLRQAIRQHPDFVGALSLLVTVSEHFDDKAEADRLRATINRREFTDLSDPWADSLSEDCYDAYRLSVKAGIANFSRDPATAQRLLERAIELAPDSGAYRRQLGLILSRQGDRPAARRQLAKAVAVSPADAESWSSLVRILTEMEEPALAEQAAVSGLGHCPLSSELHLQYARQLRLAGRTDQAIAEFREAHRLRPNDASTLAELASVYITVNRWDEAIAALQSALERQPEHPITLATLVLCSIRAGDQAGARTWWDRVRRQPRTPPESIRIVKQEFQRRFGQPLP